AGNHAGEEQAADRNRHQPAPDHHQYGGRNNNPHDARAGGDGNGEGGIVALLLHLRNEERANAGGVGGGAAGDAGEQHRDNDVDMAETSREVPHHGAGEVDQAIGNAGGVHEIGGEQEEGDCQQHEGIVALEHLPQQQDRGQSLVEEEDGHHRQAQRKGNGHPQDDENG